MTGKIRWSISLVVLTSLVVVAQGVPLPAMAVATTPTFVTKWGSSGSGDGEFANPQGIATDSSGNVYVVDGDNNRVQKFSSAGVFITKWGSFGWGDGEFVHPNGIAIDSSDNVYVIDNGSRVQKFTSSGVFVSIWGDQGAYDGATFYPQDLAIDSQGNFYISDYLNDRVQKFTSAGVFDRKWGSSGVGDGQFSYPAGIEVDSSDNVYVADGSNNRVQKFTADGVFVAKWGTTGAGDGEFVGPRDIAVDSSGNIYVSDYFGSRVQKFTSAGVFVSKWGTNGYGDGEFVTPYGLAIDSSDNVYVSEIYGQRVQKFSYPSEPETLYVKPDPKTVTFGASAPTYTFKYYSDSGYVTEVSSPSVTTAPSCSSSYVVGTAVNVYTDDITCSGGDAGASYAYDFSAKADLTVTQATASASYTGTTSVALGGTITLSATITPAACSATPTYTLTKDPFTGLSVLSYELTGPTVSTSGWQPGVYVITVTYADDGNCGAATDSTSSIAVGTTTPGSAFGGGWYVAAGGRANFGFQLRSDGSAVGGQLVWIKKGAWRFKGTLSTYNLSGDLATATGTGKLWFWRNSSGSGKKWVLATTSRANVTITFKASTPRTKMRTGTNGSFAIGFDGTPVAGSPALPDLGSLIKLMNGNIKIS